MITARELQHRRLVKLDEAISKIEKTIIRADDRGARSATVTVDANWPVAEITAQLRSAGYNVTRTSGSDMRECYDYLTITWD